MKRRIEVKICGLTNRDDAQAALDAGADYLGFVLYPHSPRGIRAARLPDILEKLDGEARAVAVVVNESRATVERIARDCRLFAVQLHGDEAAHEFRDFPLPIWRALWGKSGVCCPDPSVWLAERFVLDASVPGKFGGSGMTADWQVAAGVAGQYRVMLAGGLTPANVADAIRAVRPWGVDTAGGVERERGKKDVARIKRFIEAARGAEVQ